jgi:hypothetical protein
MIARERALRGDDEVIKSFSGAESGAKLEDASG